MITVEEREMWVRIAEGDADFGVWIDYPGADEFLSADDYAEALLIYEAAFDAAIRDHEKFLVARTVNHPP